MHITVREAQATDIPATAVLFDLYRQFYEQPSDPTLAHDFIAERMGRGESVILVAESARGLLGFCQLYPSYCSVEAKPIYTLYDLFVKPEHRKAGVGRLLLEAAQAHAVRTGKARMDLTTAKTNGNAQRLYESHGWIRDEVFLTYNRRVLSS